MYRVFKTSEEMDEFFSKNVPIKEKNRLEFSVMENYENFRIVFVAPHKVTSRIYVDKNRFIGVGDKNTDKLAKLAAARIKSCYIAPKFSRLEADLTRDPNMLGKGIKLRSPLYGGRKKEIVEITIHKEKNFLKILNFYHDFLESLKPKMLVFFHGMGSRHKADIAFGFGEEETYIGGHENAVRFLKMFESRLFKAFSSVGMKNKLNVVIAKFFKATKDYGLKFHVFRYNENHSDKRYGMNVEFNLRGRTTLHDKNLPSVEYQIASQVLADVCVEWLFKLSQKF